MVENYYKVSSLPLQKLQRPLIETQMVFDVADVSALV